MLIGQAAVVTLLATVFLFMPSVNGSYWILTALAAQLYMLMYLLMFITAIKLRFKAPQQVRVFRVPGGIIGLILVAGTGIIGTCLTLMVSFIPPIGINVGNLDYYALILLSGLIVLCAIPMIIGRLQRKCHEIQSIISITN